MNGPQLCTVEQEVYRRGSVPEGDHATVHFGVPMLFALAGNVSNGASYAFSGKLASKAKVSIRFGVSTGRITAPDMWLTLPYP